MNFDILMPTILLITTVVSMFLSSKMDSRIKKSVESREFKTRDVAFLVATIAVAVSVIAFIPETALLIFFLFSYASLLFTFSYVFSDMQKKKAVLFSVIFAVSAMVAGVLGFAYVLPQDIRIIGTIMFAGLATCSFIALLASKSGLANKRRWYLAVLPPALFLLLFAFYGQTPVWFPYLLDVFGLLFASLIVIYLGSLFNWKTTFMFAGFITILDIILVWVTQTMVEAATAISGLGLPVLVAFPTIPFITTETGILIMRLGLGDFFFAGILGTQTLKKYGKKTAIGSMITTAISFAIFELILLNPSLQEALPVPALPATLPIILGWLPLIIIRIIQNRKTKIVD